MTMQAQRPGRVLITKQQIEARVREIGQRLAADLQAELAREQAADTRASAAGPGHAPPMDAPADRVVMVPILTGAVIFVADLIREMPMTLSMRVVSVSSYAGKVSQRAAMRGALPEDLGGRHIVVVDDILDTGQTLAMVRDLILEQNPASLRICAMLRKKVPRKHEVHLDYFGFDIDDEFVVGYGLDYHGLHRNLPDIVALDHGA